MLSLYLKALFLSQSLCLSLSHTHIHIHRKHYTLSLMDLYIRDRGTQTVPWSIMIHLAEQKVWLTNYLSLHPLCWQQIVGSCCCAFTMRHSYWAVTETDYKDNKAKGSSTQVKVWTVDHMFSCPCGFGLSISPNFLFPLLFNQLLLYQSSLHYKRKTNLLVGTQSPLGKYFTWISNSNGKKVHIQSVHTSNTRHLSFIYCTYCRYL